MDDPNDFNNLSANNIINNLTILASLTPGNTLSTSTMTVINHGTWSGSIWRTYSKENRKETIFHIKRIFLEALTYLKVNITDGLTDSCKNIIIGIEIALKGIVSLKDTYAGDYYAIADINAISESVQKDLASILSTVSNKDVVSPNSDSRANREYVKARIRARKEEIALRRQNSEAKKRGESSS